MLLNGWISKNTIPINFGRIILSKKKFNFDRITVFVTICYIYVYWIYLITIFVTLVTIFVTLVIISVTTDNTSYTLFIQDIIDKDMTNYNKQNMLYIVTKFVT